MTKVKIEKIEEKLNGSHISDKTKEAIKQKVKVLKDNKPINK